MKSKRELKKRIKDLSFYISFAKFWNFLDMVEKFEEEKKY